MFPLALLALSLHGSDTPPIQTVNFSPASDSLAQTAQPHSDAPIEREDALQPTTPMDTLRTAASNEARPALRLPSMAAVRQYRSGQSRRNVGRILGWCGVGSFATGLLVQQPEFTTAGLVALQVGLPIYGSGASDMTKAAYAGDPTLEDDASGWTAYKVGWGFFGAGTALVYAGFIKILFAFGEEGRAQADGEKFVVAGGFALLGGVISQGIAWGQFSHSASDAESSLARQGMDFSLAPQLHRNKHGLKPGIGLLARF